MVKDYLDESTYEHFDDNTSSDGEVKSAALSKTGKHLLLGAWETNSYPKVELK